MASVSFHALEKRYGSQHIVRGIDLAIDDGEFVVLVGPSGCGKSTTLRMLAGLESISGGEIRIDGKVVNALPPRARDVAMVFQDYALYPHKTIYENMAFGLRVRRHPADEIQSRVHEAAEILGITNLLKRRPKDLSGGQRQRAAMGRAIVRRPQVFLFDEPLSNLDANLRGQLRAEIKKLHQTVGTTSIFVTHDQTEAMTLADRIVILRGGEIQQVGTPDEIYERPVNMFVAGFIGAPSMSFLPARRQDGRIALADGVVVDNSAAGDARDVLVGIRPEHFVVADDARPQMHARVQLVEPLGADTLAHLLLGVKTVVARFPREVRLKVGEMLPLGVDTHNIHLFDSATEEALR